MAAILKLQNGGRYSSQITCLHFLYDSNNKKLSIHKISCFYDNLNNIATNRSTTGIYVDEELSDFQLLMYADDICMINDSVGRLQTQLNVLSVFCRQYGLSVNLSKTKIVVFRNGGPLRRCERFYFDGAQLQSVSHYKYLGIIFSSRFCWSVPLQTLAAQADH